MSLDELRVALACDGLSDYDREESGEREIVSRIEDVEGFVKQVGAMEEIVKKLSAGLVEVRHTEGGRSIVQCFHETAREFLRSGGLRSLFLGSDLGKQV